MRRRGRNPPLPHVSLVPLSLCIPLLACQVIPAPLLPYINSLLLPLPLPFYPFLPFPLHPSLPLPHASRATPFPPVALPCLPCSGHFLVRRDSLPRERVPTRATARAQSGQEGSADRVSAASNRTPASHWDWLFAGSDWDRTAESEQRHVRPL